MNSLCIFTFRSKKVKTKPSENQNKTN